MSAGSVATPAGYQHDREVSDPWARLFPDERREVRSLDGTPASRFDLDDFARIERRAERPCMVYGQLRDGRWAFAKASGGDHGTYLVASDEARLWWGALTGFERSELGAAPADVPDRYGCATCNHVQPHRPCRCGCTAWDPIPAAITERAWIAVFAAIPLDRHEVVRMYLVPGFVEPTLVVMELRDGRWASLHLGEIRRYRVVGDREALWFEALDERDRERLAPQLIEEDRPLALVWLDGQIGSGDPTVSARAEEMAALLRREWGM
jgi:hypothetical protein